MKTCAVLEMVMVKIFDIGVSWSFEDDNDELRRWAWSHLSTQLQSVVSIHVWDTATGLRQASGSSSLVQEVAKLFQAGASCGSWRQEHGLVSLQWFGSCASVWLP